MTAPAQTRVESGSCHLTTAEASLPARFHVMSWLDVSKIGKVRQKAPGRWLVDIRSIGVRLYSDRGEILRTKAQAERLLTVIRGRHRKGRQTLEQIVEEFIPDQSKRHLVPRHLKAWLAVKTHEAEETLSPEYARTIRIFCKPGGHFSYFDGFSIHELDFKMLQAWRFWLRDHQSLKNPRYVRSVMGHFRAFLSWLRDCGELEIVPRVDYPRVPVYKPRILTMEAQAAILEAIPEEGRGIFLVCALGVRPNEARALNVSDYEDGWLTVSRAYRGSAISSPIREGDKARSFKRIPLIGRDGARTAAAEWIERHVLPHRIGDAPMFVNPARGNRWGMATMRRWWNKASDAAGVPRGRFYEDTKHTYATDMARRGVPERLQQAWLGHASASSTRRYAMLAEDALQDVLGPLAEVEKIKKADTDSGHSGPSTAPEKEDPQNGL